MRLFLCSNLQRAYFKKPGSLGGATCFTEKLCKYVGILGKGCPMVCHSPILGKPASWPACTVLLNIQKCVPEGGFVFKSSRNWEQRDQWGHLSQRSGVTLFSLDGIGWDGKECGLCHLEILSEALAQSSPGQGRGHTRAERWRRDLELAPGHACVGRSFLSQLFSWPPRGNKGGVQHLSPPSQLPS